MRGRNCILPAVLLTAAIIILAACAPTTKSQGMGAAEEVQAKPAPKGSIQVELPGTAPRTQPSVPFVHSYHDQMQCDYCHHMEPVNGDYSCCVEGCHTNRTSKEGGQSYWAAFHAQEGGSCMNCHIEERAYGKNKDVPVECSGCHIS